MPKNGTRLEVNSFVKGLITEASPLNFPANASFDEVNFELNRDGTRHRRLGIGLEAYEIKDVSQPSSVSLGYGITLWKSVNGDSSVDFLVVQTGEMLFIYDNNSTTTIGSTLKGSLSVSLNPNIVWSMASVNGKLIIAGDFSLIFVVTYNSVLGTFSIEGKALIVRDQWGVQESDVTTEGDNTYRPATLTDTHKYNLYNQSWGVQRKDKMGGVGNPISLFNTDLSAYPSNSEQVWSGLYYQAVVSGADPYERLYTNLFDDRRGVDSTTSLGYFKINFLLRGISRRSEYIANQVKYPFMSNVVPVIPDDTTAKGASVLVEFAGRIFYSGFNGESTLGDSRSPITNNYVLFSKLVKTTDDITKCYQEGDPTSRESFDIVDTDGGVFRVAGANKIIAMSVLGAQLIIFANNGIWAVTGGNNFGFSATNYKVEKISSFGCLSTSSVVTSGTNIAFWSNEGIFGISRNQYGDLTVDSIVQGSIQTLYDEISFDAKNKSRGFYDPVDKKMRWVFKEGILFTSGSVTKELILDTTLGAFSLNLIGKRSAATPEIILGFPTSPLIGTRIRYLAVMDFAPSYTFHAFAGYTELDFMDWKAYDGVGVDAKAYLITGANTAGDGAIDKQVPYLTMYFRDTESGTDLYGIPTKASGCLCRMQWDWSNSPKSHRWGRLFQVYRKRKIQLTNPNDTTFSSGVDVVVSKTKMRGKGKAFSIYMETEPLKDCNIIGWSITLNGNANT